MTRKRDSKQIDAIVAEFGLSKDQRKVLHRIINRQKLTHQEIREVAVEVKQDHTGKRDRRHDKSL